MKAGDVARVIESVAPISSGMAGDELGFVFGGPEVEVRGVATCWSPSLGVIQEAARRGLNMICSHEPLFFQKRWSMDAEAKNVWFPEAEDEDKAVNRVRRAALEANGMCVYRAHSNWDLAPKIGILAALATTLEVGPPVKRGCYTTVHEIAPVTVDEFARKVQTKLNTGTMRTVGDMNRKVTRIGLLIGGLGQMFNSPEEMAALGAEAVVAGECLDYTLRNALELGLSLIEAGHCATENPGMRAMGQLLRRELKGAPVEFLDTGRSWSFLNA